MTSVFMSDVNTIEQAEKTLISQWLTSGRLDEAYFEECMNYCRSKDHLWCKHHVIIKELLMVSVDYENIKVFVDEIAMRQLSQCLDCVTKYHKVKKQTYNVYLDYFTQDSVDTLFSNLLERDQTRCIKNLTYNLDDLSDEQKSCLPTILHEIFNQTELLDNITLKDLFFIKLDEIIEHYNMGFDNPDHKVTGIYVLLFNERETLREWAKLNIPMKDIQITSDQFQYVHPVIEKLVLVIQAHQSEEKFQSYFSPKIEDIWSGLPALLKEFSSKSFRNSLLYFFPKFLEILFQEIEIVRKNDWNISFKYINCLIEVFHILKSETWSYIGKNISSKSFISSLIEIFIKSTETQESIIKLFYLVLDCTDFDDTEIIDLEDDDTEDVMIVDNNGKKEELESDIVINFIVKKVFNNTICNENIQTVSFELLIYILYKRFNSKSKKSNFPTKNVHDWGRRLVQYVLGVKYLDVTPNMDRIQDAIKLLNLVLKKSSVRLRSAFQYILHGTSAQCQTELLDNCEYWCSSVWSNLLISSPKFIPYTTHETLFSVIRILGLLQIPKKYDFNNTSSTLTSSSTISSKSKIFHHFREFNGLFVKYLGNFKQLQPFTIQQFPHTKNTTQADVTDCEMFTKAVFTLCVSPDMQIREAIKPILMKKYPSETITVAFKEMFKISPEKGLKGVLGTLRDVLINLDISECLDSMGSIFYYTNHLFYVLQVSLKDYMNPFLQQYVDTMWSMIEFIIKRRDVVINDIKYIFEWWKSSFSIVANCKYASIFHKENTSPPFISQSSQNHLLLFSSSDQYPKSIRSLIPSDFLKTSSSNIEEFFRFFENLFETTVIQNSNQSNANDNEEEILQHSIVYNQSLWANDFIYWYGLNDSSFSINWYDSLNEILKHCRKYKVPLNQALINLTKAIVEKPHALLKPDLLSQIKKNLTTLEQLSTMNAQTKKLSPIASTNKPVTLVPKETTLTPKQGTLEKSSFPPNFKLFIPSFDSLNNTTKPTPPTNNNSNNNNNKNSVGNPLNNLNNKPIQPISSMSSSGNNINNNKSLPNNLKPSTLSMKLDFDEFLDTHLDPFDSYYKSDRKDKKQTKIIELGKVQPSFKTKANDNSMEQYIPKIENLYKIILGWLPDKVFNGDKIINLKSIPNTFDNLNEYINIFEPLLLEEFRAQIYKVREEQEFPEKNVCIEDYDSESQFNLCVFSIEGIREFESEFKFDDLVYLRKGPCETFGKIDKMEDKEKKRHLKNIKDVDKKLIYKIRIFQLDKKKESLQTWHSTLKIGSMWSIQKLTSLTTINREYLALHSIGKSPLGSYIFSPKLLNSASNVHQPIPNGLKNVLTNTLNDAQMKAINSTLTPSGFTLIQGPPGTGKTKTIMAILSSYLAVLSKDLKRSKSNDFKILVCAPSNAAVDEITGRILKTGLLNDQGQVFHPSIVRIGNLSNIDPEVREATLDFQVDKILKSVDSPVCVEQSKLTSIKDKTNEVSKQLEDVNAKIIENNKLRITYPTGSPEEKDLLLKSNNLFSLKSKLVSEMKTGKESEGKAKVTLESSKRSLLSGILHNSTIILSTLSGSGYDHLNLLKTFDLVIVDEAAQAVEISNLIPLKYDVKKCVLVGDPNQLPPTIISKLAVSYQYQMSLFQRLKNNHVPTHILNVQYRMHPIISRFPSMHFYEDKLINGPNVTSYNQEYYKDTRFGPLIFYDVIDSSESASKSHSLYNEQESSLVYLVISNLISKFPYVTSTNMSIGVITPYKQQQREIQERIKNLTNNTNIEVNTIDGFQGKEKDIVIFSCVRAHKGNSIGFLSDVRRMNVGLSRAKYSMIIIGNGTVLSMNPDWNEFVSYVKSVPNGYYPITSRSINQGTLAQISHSSSSSSSNSNSNTTNSKLYSTDERDTKKTKPENDKKLDSDDLRYIVNREKEKDKEKAREKDSKKSSLDPNDLRMVIESENKHKRKYE